MHIVCLATVGLGGYLSGAFRGDYSVCACVVNLLENVSIHSRYYRLCNCLKIIAERHCIRARGDVVLFIFDNRLHRIQSAMGVTGAFFILGKEKPPKLIAGIIVGRRNATFLRLLYESYKDNYRGWDWDYNCARITYQLYLKRPDLLHVEPYKLTTPDWTDRHKLWNDVIDWSDLYVVHVMAHFEHSGENYTPDNIRRLNTTFGQIMRYVYYGSPEMIPS
jgi:hypothetical protein